MSWSSSRPIFKKRFAPGREVLEEKTVGSMCYSLVKIRCGKKGCKCSRGELHGPYWYAYFRENGKMKGKYIGKTLPDGEAVLKVSEALRKKAGKVRSQCSELKEKAEQARRAARTVLASANARSLLQTPHRGKNN